MLLQGLKVVEMSTWLAAPSCAMMLAEWGAEVVKVESPAGDPMRGFYPDTPDDPGNPVFSLGNRGKRGVVLDTSQDEGRAALLSLLRQADIFVTNVRPGALRRARLDYQSLRDALPTLIYASVTGYGLEGDEIDTPAFDITGFWSRSGVAASTIPPDQEPFPCRPGFGDNVTALATLSGILAAVHERGRTGKGRLVEASLIRAGVWALGWDVSVQLRYGEATTAQPRRDRPVAMSGYFQTADGRWLCVVPRGPRCFPAFLAALDLGDLLADPRLGQPTADLAVARDLRARFDRAFASLTLEEAGKRLDAADVIWAPMAQLADVVVDAQVEAAGCFVDSLDSWGGVFRAAATPIRFSDMDISPRRAAPQLGQHTREVLAEAGLAADLVERLSGDGAAASAK